MAEKDKAVSKVIVRNFIVMSYGIILNSMTLILFKQVPPDRVVPAGIQSGNIV